MFLPKSYSISTCGNRTRPPRPKTTGLSVAHLSCIPGDPASFVCPPCAAAAENRPFSFTPAPPAGARGRCTLDKRDARVLLVAARLAHDSISRAAAATRKVAERRVAEVAAAQKRSRKMLDAAFRAPEAEAREAKMMPKKKAPKSAEANRDKDRLLKLNAMQQLALAVAAAAAATAAVSLMPLSTVPPPTAPREDKKPVKQEAQGSAPPPPLPPLPREDRPPLFGALQS